jgi:hypothetical protein
MGECPADRLAAVAEDPKVQAAGSTPETLTVATFPFDWPASVLEGACLYSYETREINGADITRYGGFLVPTTADIVAALEASPLNMRVQIDDGAGYYTLESEDGVAIVSLTPRSGTDDVAPEGFESRLNILVL